MKICVYCSSSSAVPEPYFVAARELGVCMANAKCDLVYGGANVGLMGEIAQTVSDSGRQVIGVMPEFFMDKDLESQALTELHVTENMRERKSKMESLSDGFIALPGGLGTFEEIFEILTLKQLGQLDKPIVFLNVNQYYNPLVNMLHIMYTQAFAKPETQNLYLVTDSVVEAMTYILEYEENSVGQKWF